MALLDYPIFASNDDRIDLRNIYDETTFAFDTDFTPPTWLTLETNHELVVANNAVSAATPVLVKLDNSEEFYLVVEPGAPPSLRVSADELNMLSNSSYDLFLIVDNASSIAFESGRTQPTGSSLTNGVFTIATTGGTAYFTATNDNGSIDFDIRINVVQTELDIADFAETSRYRIEIAGIDVSADLLNIPPITESTEADTLNENFAGDATVVLVSESGRYNEGIANNFWQTHSLTPGGFQERINIFKEYYINNVWVSHVAFSGIILRAVEDIEAITVSLTCIDVSTLLTEIQAIRDFGTFEKWAVLFGDNPFNLERITSYEPGNVLPILPNTVKAWVDSTELPLQRVTLPSEGPPSTTPVGQITDTAVNTIGNLSDEPILRFKTLPQSKSLEFVANQLVLQAGFYQVNFDVNTPTLQTPYIQNRGSLPFNTERTKILRYPNDWCYDETEDRILMLMAAQEASVPDRLVQYQQDTDTYKTLHTFENDTNALRITRLNSTTYYILTVEKGTLSATSVGTIYEYTATTNTLTERVSSTDTNAPYVSVRYYSTNDTPSADVFLADKGSFKCVDNTLYFKYRNGVATLQGSTITSVVSESGTAGTFVFDVLDNGDICYGYQRTFTTPSTTIADEAFGGTLGSHTVTPSYYVRAGGSRTISATVSADQGKTIYNISVTTSDGQTLISESNPSGLFGTHSGSVTITEDVRVNVSITYTVFSTGSSAVHLNITASAASSAGSVVRRRNSADNTTTSLGSRGDVYSFVEMIVHGDNLYTIGYENTQTATVKRTALLKWNAVSSTTPEELLDSGADGPVHFFIHQNAVHFMYNLPLWTGHTFLLLADSLGAIQRIETDGTLTSLGNLWSEGDTAWNLSLVRPLSIGAEIHTIMGYGNVRQLPPPNPQFVAPETYSNKDNALYLVYTNTLRYALSDASFSGSIFDALSEIANLVDATLSFENNIVHIRQRRALTAETDGNTGV